jgi:prepilin-type N-terminal cleavage/methylation domain-containing protein
MRIAFYPTDMDKANQHKNSSGYSLIELMIVISVVAILAVFAVPEYSRFTAKNAVRGAASTLVTNMRLARTMAIKENQQYFITFNEGGTMNYRIGFDGDNDGSLLGGLDGFGTGPVRIFNIRNEYGINVVLGLPNFSVIPPIGPIGANGPPAVALVDTAAYRFDPDGSTDLTGPVYFQHVGPQRGYAFCVDLANATGRTDLYMWQGHALNAGNPTWMELR